MSFSYDSNDYFTSNDPLVEQYQILDSTFANSADYLLVAFQNNPDVFDPAFIYKLRQFSHDIRNSTVVENVHGIHNYQYIKKTPFGLIQTSALSALKENSAFQKNRILQDPRTKNLVINKDGTATCVLIQTIKKVTGSSANELIEDIFQSADKHELPSPKLAGRLYTETSYLKQLEKENLRLTPLFIIIVSLVLLLLYRSWIAALLPTISVIAGLIILYGYAASVGRDINIATLMYPTVMAVVGIADLIHLYTKYQAEINIGRSKIESIRISIKELKATLFLTSLTTMIGFLCVSRSSIPYVHIFGLDSAIGVAIAFLVAIFLTPVLLYYIPVQYISSRKFNWSKFLDRTYQFGKTYSRTIVYVCILLMLISLFGISQINTNNTLLDAIGDKSSLKQEFKYIESEFSGVRTLEILVQMKNGKSIDDLKTLQSIEQLENYLLELPYVGNVTSPSTYYKSLNDARHGARLSHYRLPSSTKEFNKINGKAPIKNPFVSSDQKLGLISARMHDVGRKELDLMIHKLQDWIGSKLADSEFNIIVTGRDRLIDRTNEMMVRSLFEGLIAAMVLIIGIIFLIFRSAKMMMISLVPNLLPLVLTGGAMGYLGVELNGSSAIIFTIAFVIAVDDTIHFLKKYAYLKKNQSLTKEESIHQTVLQAGKAILITSLILISGYSILMLSEFKEAYYHGVLISFTLIWALLSDLLLLPILIRKYAE